MKKQILSFLLVLVLITGIMPVALGADTAASVPPWGTISGNTWTVTMPQIGSMPHHTYSFTPVPAFVDTHLEYGRYSSPRLKLARGTVLSFTVASAQIWAITEWDSSSLYEHTISLPPVFEGRAGTSHTFHNPGMYIVVFMHPSSDTAMSMRTVEVLDDPTPQPPQSHPFTDVRRGEWYYDYVRYVFDHGLMTGTSANQFSPESALTRGMLATILHREAGSPTVSGPPPFTDVAPGAWYANGVNWAASQGIVFGVGDGRFAPNHPITRQDFAVMLLRYANWSGTDLPAVRPYIGFTDSNAIAGYAAEAVQALFRAGVINGMPGNMFAPTGNATRAQSAAMLYRFLTA